MREEAECLTGVTGVSAAMSIASASNVRFAPRFLSECDSRRQRSLRHRLARQQN